MRVHKFTLFAFQVYDKFFLLSPLFRLALAVFLKHEATTTENNKKRARYKGKTHLLGSGCLCMNENYKKGSKKNGE